MKEEKLKLNPRDTKYHKKIPYSAIFQQIGQSKRNG